MARIRWRRAWSAEHGSNVAQAAAVALVAALLIGGLLLSSRSLGPAVGRAFDCLAGAISGGGTCALGAAADTPINPAADDIENTQSTGTGKSDEAPGAGETAASIGLDFIPVVGEIKGLIEVFTGTDLVTGEDLGWWRFAGLAGLVGLNEIKHLRHVDDVVDAVGTGARRGDDLLDAGSDAARRRDDVISPCRIGASPGHRSPGLAAPLAGCDDIGPNPDVNLLSNKPINSKYAGQTYPLEGRLKEKYGDGVRFDKDGFPDFTPFAKINEKTGKPDIYQIAMKGDRTTDFTAANRAAGYKKPPDGYVWHHHQDRKTMILVPRDLHEEVRHTGGVSIIGDLGRLP